MRRFDHNRDHFYSDPGVDPGAMDAVQAIVLAIGGAIVLGGVLWLLDAIWGGLA